MTLLLPRAELVLRMAPPDLEVDRIVVVILRAQTIEEDQEVVVEVELGILQELPRALLQRPLESINTRKERRKRRWIGKGNADAMKKNLLQKITTLAIIKMIILPLLHTLRVAHTILIIMLFHHPLNHNQASQHILRRPRHM